MLWYSLKVITEALLMRLHNICFIVEKKKKIFTGKHFFVAFFFLRLGLHGTLFSHIIFMELKNWKNKFFDFVML